MVSVPYLTTVLSYHAMAFFEKKACVSRKNKWRSYLLLFFFSNKVTTPPPHLLLGTFDYQISSFSFLSKTISSCPLVCCLYCFKNFNDSCINQVIFSNLKKLFSHCFSTHSINYYFVRT